MRTVDLTVPMQHQPEQAQRLAWLARHFHARLLDFGPGGPEITDWSEEKGVLWVRFPGHSTKEVLSQLHSLGVETEQQGDLAVFHLHPETRFEDLDYVWGSLFQCLGE